jgi:DNA-binding transcriptional LysR family regulator
VNLDTLRLYCDVVRLRSFSRAAAASGVSQSAASQAIQQLETELDATLLDRSRRPLEPTAEGRGFYDACRGLLAGFEKARADLAASRQRVEGTVRVAAIYSVGLHDMSRHMQPFMAAFPNARVLLECLHPHKVVEAVLNDEADLGILSYPAPSRALEVLPLREEPMVVVTHPSHPLARRRRVSPADLDGARFVAFDHDLPIRRAIDRTLKQHGVKVDVAMEFDNVETIKQAIGIAAGISILPAPTVQKESEIKTLAAVELALPGLVRPVAIIHRRGRHLTTAVSRFIAQLRDDDARVETNPPAPASVLTRPRLAAARVLRSSGKMMSSSKIVVT